MHGRSMSETIMAVALPPVNSADGDAAAQGTGPATFGGIKLAAFGQDFLQGSGLCRQLRVWKETELQFTGRWTVADRFRT